MLFIKCFYGGTKSASGYGPRGTKSAAGPNPLLHRPFNVLSYLTGSELYYSDVRRKLSL